MVDFVSIFPSVWDYFLCFVVRVFWCLHCWCTAAFHHPSNEYCVCIFFPFLCFRRFCTRWPLNSSSSKQQTYQSFFDLYLCLAPSPFYPFQSQFIGIIQYILFATWCCQNCMVFVHLNGHVKRNNEIDACFPH